MSGAMRIVPAERRLTKVIRKSARPGQEPWEQRWKGLSWEDMPTVGGYEHMLLDYALFRWGMYDPELDLVVDEEELDADELGGVRRRTRAQRGYGAIGGHGRMALAAAMRRKAMGEAEAAAAAAALEGRMRRQGEALAMWGRGRLTRGFAKAFYRVDATAHSAMMRAMGMGRGCVGPLREVSLDRIERVFAQLKEEGWKL